MLDSTCKGVAKQGQLQRQFHTTLTAVEEISTILAYHCLQSST